MSAPFFWLSFVDIDRASGSRFLGCIITRAVSNDLRETLQKLHHLGINPGGEVQGVMFSGEAPLPPEYLDRLLSREESEHVDNILLRPN